MQGLLGPHPPGRLGLDSTTQHCPSTPPSVLFLGFLGFRIFPSALTRETQTGQGISKGRLWLGRWGAAVCGESLCSFCREPDPPLESERRVRTAAGGPAEARGCPSLCPTGQAPSTASQHTGVSHFGPQAAELPVATLGSPPKPEVAGPTRERGPEASDQRQWAYQSRVEPRRPCTGPSQAPGPGPQGEGGAPGPEVARQPPPPSGGSRCLLCPPALGRST